MPNPRRNQQTKWLCDKLGIQDPLELALKRQNRNFENDFQAEEDEKDIESAPESKGASMANDTPKTSEQLTTPVNDSQTGDELQEISVASLRLD